MDRKRKHTKAKLENVVKDCICLRDVLRSLGLKIGGGSQAHMRNLLKKYEIDVSHFLGQASRKGKTNGLKKHWSEILVLHENRDRREHAFMLRRALAESGREQVCAKCGQGNEWHGDALVLEVHHMNGNWLDNRETNLCFHCPNCHQQADAKLTMK